MRKRPRPDRIAQILRDIRADLDAGLNTLQACRKAGIGQNTPRSVRGRIPGEPETA